MKKSTLKSLLLIIMLVTTVNISAQVAIGHTNPSSASMLDIQSTSKGVLIPRMTTAQRTAIVGVEGLLVFDSTSQSFWYYSGSSWVELANGTGNEISDVDADTKIEVEQSADEDKIRMSTAGSERVIIDNTGNTRIGDGTNNTYIESDGSLRYEGTATRYDDLKIPMNATNRGTSNMPEWLLFRNNGSQGVWLWSFSSNLEEELYFVVQLPHGWKEGSDIYPHVHWTTKVGQSGNVKWALEYTWSNIGDNFGAPTIISSSTITVGNSGTAYNHNLTSLPSISATGKNLSSMLICRIYRDGDHVDDTFNNEAQILELDFHYQIDADGSREQYVK